MSFLSRSGVVGSALLATALPFTLAAAEKVAAAPTRPNILFVYPDELRPQAIGWYGREPVLTPNIDRFARESLALPQATSCYPVCVPYRTMLMSGQYPFSNGVTTNCFDDDRNMKDSVIWLPDVLNNQGYTLGYLGKWHISKPILEYQGRQLKGVAREFVPPEQRHHFDYWYHHTTNSHLNATAWSGADKQPEQFEKLQKWSPEYDADNAVRYLLNEGGKVRDPAKPFCLFISMNPPHSPYGQVPPRYLEPYKDLDVEALAAKTPDVPPDTAGMGKYYRKQVKNYYAGITGVDEQFGRILAALDQAGLKENTIVIFTSDHGNCLGRHKEITKNNPYEESIRVPFFIRWPAKIKPRSDDLLITTPDLYPTLLGLAGCDQAIPKQIEGRNFAPLLLTGQGERPAFQPYYYIPTDKEKGRNDRGIRTLTHTLAINLQNPKEPVLLFDNAADPFQMHNLAAEKPELAATLLRQHLIPWLQKTQDPWLAEAKPLLDTYLEKPTATVK
jgi:arylsulfatase A-like enzyme